MTVYGDLYMLQNGLCDALVLCLTATLVRAPVKKPRIALGALIGAIFALLSLFLSRPLSILLSFPVSVLMVLSSIAVSGARKRIFALAVFYLSSFFLSGVVAFIGNLIGGVLDPPFPGLILAGVLLLSVLGVLLSDEILRRRAVLRRAALTFTYGGKNYRISALPDTGNLLFDGPTGLPVVLLSADVLPFLPLKCRMIRVWTATGSALLPLVEPEDLTVDGVRSSALFAVLRDPVSFGGAPSLLPASLSSQRKSRARLR